MMTSLQAKHTDFEFRAVTDDIVPLAPPPPSNSFEDWQALYVRYAQCLIDIKELSFSLAGLKLNQEKCGLLLPAGALLPTPEVRALFRLLLSFVKTE